MTVRKRGRMKRITLTFGDYVQRIGGGDNDKILVEANHCFYLFSMKACQHMPAKEPNANCFC